MTTPLADMIPTMPAADLTTLRANAARLVETGAGQQALTAAEIIPLIDAEVARRAALPPAATVKKRAAPKKKLAPVTGHQTALPG